MPSGTPAPIIRTTTGVDNILNKLKEKAKTSKPETSKSNNGDARTVLSKPSAEKKTNTPTRRRQSTYLFQIICMLTAMSWGVGGTIYEHKHTDRINDFQIQFGNRCRERQPHRNAVSNCIYFQQRFN